MRRTWGTLALVAMDAILLSAAYLGAFWLRLGWQRTAESANTIAITLPIVVGISLLIHLRCRLYTPILRYASVDTAVTVVKSVAYSVLLSCLVLFLLFRLEGIPRAIFVIHGMAAVLLVGGVRLAVRSQRREGHSGKRDTVVPILLYGAGDTAELVLRSLRLSRDPSYLPLGLIDDDPVKQGRRIHGIKIYEGLRSFPDICRSAHVEELWVCVPNLVGEKLRRVYEAASPWNVRVKILPRFDRTLPGTRIPPMYELKISDLLRRPARSLDRRRMHDWIRGRRVLITGAGGSIGSELARQVARLEPESLALCDASETNLFHIDLELSSFGRKVLERPYLVDVRDAAGVQRMFENARPEIVFHAAAYKHVPLVELNPCEGVLTNIQGLRNVALAALDNGVSEFVFISTDKAVRPASVMGATKRLGEILVQVLNRENSTRLSAVRFGNVLGSSGSVVEIFQEQIRRGGPVTVTHPDMTRYFMLLSEAVELVIQASSIGNGGEIFVLDMGTPVRIDDMARDLIRLMGKEPGRDVPIEYTGCRPGEKMHEELLVGPQDTKTSFEDIWIDGELASDVSWPALGECLQILFDEARAGNRKRALLCLERLVPAFEPICDETKALLRVASEQEARVPAASASVANAAAQKQARESVLGSGEDGDADVPLPWLRSSLS